MPVRLFVRVLWDIEKGNELAKKGKLGEVVGSILEELKPEAVYFPADAGNRSTFLVVNVDDASQLPAIAEPWFLALNATVEFQPIMLAEDLQKADADISEAGKKYG